uniref:E3 ubiquitin-protein ligase TRIM39-like n=1 Tax=Gopherus evgoodei TaxID=1825980 RepID=A0A8C4YAS1_9SAUR
MLKKLLAGFKNGAAKLVFDPVSALQDEVSCSICLEYLRDPVTIDCGHNFCCVCITNYCERWEGSTAEVFFCPQCRAGFLQTTFRPNKQLANIVEGIEQLALQPDKEPKEKLYMNGMHHVILFLSLVDVTLDPNTANAYLLLSQDRRSVRVGDKRQDVPSNPERFDMCTCILGQQRFTAGRHYWEVEVGDKTCWTLGVCEECVSRQGIFTPSPATGFWTVWLRNGNEYAALTSHLTELTLRVKPRQIGILLDYEAGEVSFYNVNGSSHIYTFSDTFLEPLRPYFYPGVRAGGLNDAPLTLRPGTQQP